MKYKEVSFANILERHAVERVYDRYYITAAPQCVFPDAALGGVLNEAEFDAIYGLWYFCVTDASALMITKNRF